MVLERWLTELAEALDVVDELEEIDEEALLDAARVVAHSVERRAAPLSTFLIGLAVAKTDETVDELSGKAIAAARAFETEAE